MGRDAAIDEEDDYEDDPEDPDPSDMDDESAGDDDNTDVATDECPHCGADVYEFTEKCPACDRYLSQEDAPPRTRHPKWIVITATILLLTMLYALLKWWL